eukprot:488251-Prymnesium_polylepis.1
MTRAACRVPRILCSSGRGRGVRTPWLAAPHADEEPDQYSSVSQESMPRVHHTRRRAERRIGMRQASHECHWHA